MDNNSCFISRFCLSWTILVGISPSFVCHGHYYLVNLTVLSVINNNGWYVSQFSLSWTCHVIGLYISQFILSWTLLVGISTGFVCRRQKWLVYQPVLSVMDNIGWYINRFCLSWTISVGISSRFVCRGQYWLVYHPVLSVMDNIGWYISQFCLSLTILVGLSPVFVCLFIGCLVKTRNYSILSLVFIASSFRVTEENIVFETVQSGPYSSFKCFLCSLWN